MRGLLVICTLLALSACQPDIHPEGAGSIPEGQACTKAGGTIIAGLAGPTCAMPEPDAGKICQENSDCSGFCVVNDNMDTQGTCSPTTPYFGCHNVLVAEGKVAGICID